jgi:hypothetical protein
MAKKTINTGVEGNDATGDPIRDAFQKTNENFDELYSLFGKGTGLRFTDLSDYDPSRNKELVSNSIFIVNNNNIGDTLNPGDKILAKTLVGDGIEIINTQPDTITFRNLGSKLLYDTAPTLGVALNADNNIIYNLNEGSVALANSLSVNINSFAATRGFVGSNFVELAGDTMRGALNVRAEPSVPQTNVSGYSGSFSSNYLTTEAMQRKDSVYRGGDSLTGPLLLSADPNSLSHPLTAATKNYVDTNAFSSQVNLFVSVTTGNDFRFDVPEEKRGRALAYAFKTLNRACFKAESLIKNAEIELGPYQKPIFFNNGRNISRAVGVTTTTVNNVTTYVLTITNGGSTPGTDMRGSNISSDTANIDVRAGLIIRGTTSGALAMITVVNAGVGANVSINGISDGGTETYNIVYKNLKNGVPVPFIAGEPLEYSDSVKKLNITIFIESGEYYENLPIRVPANVTLVGDDTRRVIIRPKTGTSGSIWSNIYFRRDPTIDNLPVTTDGITFGYHYLSNPSTSFYSGTISNDGGKVNAQNILNFKKTNIQSGVTAWIVVNYPGYTTDQLAICTRDIGTIIDAIGFDLIYGGYSKILESAISFFTASSPLIVLDSSPSLTKTLAIINQLNDQINSAIVTTNGVSPESGFDNIVTSLVGLFKKIISKDSSINLPKDNNQMDVFLLNDSNRIRTLSAQGHGGFMGVLDPEGQVLTKSPYIFQCSSFSKSINTQQFAGGLFVDAFCGNLICTISNRISDTAIKVSGLTYRTPTNIPVSFYVNGIRFEVDYIDKLTGYGNGEYILYLNANTPDNTSYTTTTSLFTTNLQIELQTAGNRSMLCSDFTQINDLGYGLLATNGSFLEAVSIFTYYCYRGFYSLNGSQIRSLNGSCAYGTYALSSEGSDPTEVPTPADLKYPMIQILSTYSTGDFDGKNLKNDVIVYVKLHVDRSINYEPFASSQIEFDGIVGTYFMSNSSPTLNTYLKKIVVDDQYEIYQLSLSTSGNNTGLLANIPHGTNVIVRNLKNFNVVHLPVVSSSRPSTALQFVSESDIYHLSSYAVFTQTIIATSINASGVVTVVPGSTIGFKAGESVTFTGTTFGGLITNTAYYIISVTNSTVRLTNSYADAIAQSPNGIVTTSSISYTISSSAISNNNIVLTSAITAGALKGSSFLFPTTCTGVIGLIPGNIYYLTDDVQPGETTFKLSASREDALSVSPTVLSISGTPGGTRSGAIIGGYLVGTISSNKNISATITIDSNYNYVTLTPKTGISNNTSINVEKISVNDRSRVIGMIFAWGDYIHKITTLTSVDASTDTIAFVNITNGISSSVGLSKATDPAYYIASLKPVLKAGLNNKNSSNLRTGLTLITKISVMRASGHDLVDIGTGGFASSNIPTYIYGNPAITKSQANEIQEIGRGRVFFSTTDQDGNFKVGKYFQVDQGTGSVTFSTNLTISGIDGIGFSRGGVTVKEFAADDTMRNQSSDTVPTQSAVVGYINRRLGLTYPGNTITPGILGPGFLALDGSTGMTGDLNINSHRIKNVLPPLRDSDATPKSYVDTFFIRQSGLRNDIDGFAMSNTTTFVIDKISRTVPQGGSPLVTVVLRANTTRSGIHGLSAGSSVTISGANEATTFGGYDGTYIVKSVLTSNGYIGSIGSSSTSLIFTYETPNEIARTEKTIDEAVVSAIVTTKSNISMSGAKITNLSTPTSGDDATTKTYVDTLVATSLATKDQLSELNDVAFSSILDGQPLSYNSLTSKWVNNRAIDQSKLSMRSARAFAAKPSGLLVTAENFIVNKTYIINLLGNIDQTGWNTIAGTSSSPITYSIGSIFVAKVKGATGSTGSAYEDIQANSGLSSFDSAIFSASTEGFVSINDNGLALGKIAKIGTGYVLGNNSGNESAPALVSFANALNSAITIPSGSTVPPAGVIAKESDATFKTILYDTANTNNALVQRNSTGGITVGSISCAAINPSSVASAGDISSEGKITAKGAISAKTELQIDSTKIFDYNGKITRMFNQDGVQALEVSGSSTAVTGKFYGAWTLASGATLNATYADLAEYYTSDNDYSAGTIVMIGGDQDVTLAKGYGNTAVAGVVSENPAYLMNSACEGIRVAVALQGRVPCKVVGTIKKGDLLIVSQVAGAATSSKDPKPGSIIGKALANYDSDRIGMIEVLVGKH